MLLSRIPGSLCLGLGYRQQRCLHPIDPPCRRSSGRSSTCVPATVRQQFGLTGALKTRYATYLVAHVRTEILQPTFPGLPLHARQVVLDLAPLITRLLREVDAVHCSSASFRKRHGHLEAQSTVCAADKGNSVLQRKFVLEDGRRRG